MEDRERVEILSEILRERMPSLRHIIQEWSVPEADAFNYAQAKDLIWQLAAPLGLSMLGFSATERARQEDPGDLDVIEAQARFGGIGEEVGDLLEQFLQIAEQVRR